MRLLTTSLFTASLMVTAPAVAQETPAARPLSPASWGYAPHAQASLPPAASPYGWGPPPGPVVTERRSEGMRITGITLFAVGGVTTAIGGVLFGIGATTGYCTDAGGGVAPRAHRPRERIGTSRQADLGGCGGNGIPLGASVMGAGFLGSVAGIPLFVLGNARVRARPHDATAPELRVRLGGADLRWTF